MTKKVNVLIVDDSRVSQEILAHILQSDPEIKVVGAVENGDKALHWLQNNTCDAITMDIQMPILDGFEVTQRIMETKPTPIVIISGCYTATDKQMSFRALEVGAMAILEKPSGFRDVSYKEKSQEIINTVKTIAEIKAKKRVSLIQTGDLEKPKEKHAEIKAIAIGASLGGPLAICEILKALPHEFPVPLFIVQHIAAGFTEGFVKWLQEYCKLPVYLAKDKELAKPGCVYVAADSLQMEIKKGNVISLADHAESKLQPSVGHLFKSMAETYGPAGVGVILTGMGKDGARELLLMKQKGAYTIAQDEESCLMYGMPKEAILLGAAKHILPVQKIARTLMYLVNPEKNGK